MQSTVALLLGGAVTVASVWWALARRGRSLRDGGARTFTLHRAEHGDRAALAQLVIHNHLELSAACPQEWLAQLRDMPTDFAHLLDAAEFSRGRYRVARDSRTGRIVGAAGITPPTTQTRSLQGGSNWMLTAVTVAENWRRLGIAQHLVRLVLQDAKEAGAECVAATTLLELMEGAWRLYERLGFRRVSAEIVAQEPRPMTVLSFELRL